MTRRKQLHDQPLCQHGLEDDTTCGLLAEHVHHIQDLRDGGPPRDPANLMSLCAHHHNAITRARQRGEGVP